MSEQNVANQYGLGAQTGRYRKSGSGVFSGIVLVGIGGASLALWVYDLVAGSRSIGTYLGLLGFGLLMLAGGIYLIVTVNKRRRILVTVFADGFVYHGLTRDIVMRWDDIADVQENWFTASGRQFSNYRVVSKNGGTVSIEAHELDTKKLGAVIKGHVAKLKHLS